MPFQVPDSSAFRCPESTLPTASEHSSSMDPAAHLALAGFPFSLKFDAVTGLATILTKYGATVHVEWVSAGKLVFRISQASHPSRKAVSAKPPAVLTSAEFIALGPPSCPAISREALQRSIALPAAPAPPNREGQPLQYPSDATCAAPSECPVAETSPAGWVETQDPVRSQTSAVAIVKQGAPAATSTGSSAATTPDSKSTASRAAALMLPPAAVLHTAASIVSTGTALSSPGEAFVPGLGPSRMSPIIASVSVQPRPLCRIHDSLCSPSVSTLIPFTIVEL